MSRELEAGEGVVAVTRDGCCSDWPKPCSYHEGWIDGYEVATTMAELIERSSLGTPGAKALRSRTPPEVVDRIMRKVDDLTSDDSGSDDG